jgi:hypothetical protein
MIYNYDIKFSVSFEALDDESADDIASNKANIYEDKNGFEYNKIENDCDHENTTLIETGSGRGHGYAVYKCNDCGEKIYG